MRRKSGLGEPMMRWVNAPFEAPIAPDDDAPYLRRTLRIADLAKRHPLRALWATESPQARFAMHHLADDLRLLEGVRGWTDVVKKLRTDVDAYDDTRYEVRIAAALRRSGQTLSHLAGSKTGPDMTFVSGSGHECAVACYRVRSATPAVAELRKASKSVARHLFRLCSFVPGNSMRLFDVVLPEIPVLPAHLDDAKNALEAAWRSPQPRGDIRAQTVVAWAPLPRLYLRPAETDGVYLRVFFKHPAYELRRARGHIRNKLELESKWAAPYNGRALIAIEESDAIAGGGSIEIVRDLLRSDGAAFSGALVTYFARDVLMDEMRYIAGTRHDATLHVALTTFGPNVQVWAQKQHLHQWRPEHSREHWRIAQTRAGRFLELLKSLSYPIASFRTDPPRTKNATDDPDYMARVRQAIENMRARDDELVAPPPILLPLHDDGA